MNVAIIPARGGSKRIPGKNIRNFRGRPIIQYSIEAAQRSEVFDRIIISTDDDRIAEVAQAAGAEVPFRRPEELANDHALTLDAVRHAVIELDRQGSPLDFACCIYASTPFLRASDIQVGFEKISAAPEADFAFPVATMPYPFQRSMRKTGDRLEMFFPEYESTRSQDLDEAWHDAGQFYWGTNRSWRNAPGIFTGTSVGIPIPRFRVQDIDTIEDWRRAELMYEVLLRTNEV